MRLSRHARFFLLVLYHFGLRPGEAGRLTFGELDYGDDGLTLLIRPTTFGELKTDAARRKIPQLQRFEPDELALVCAMIRGGEANDGDDALVLSAPGAPQQRYNARLVEARVVQALRAASGDPTLTLYACRHAFATRVALALAASPPLPGLAGRVALALWGSHEAAARARATLLAGQDHSAYRWEMLADLLGHADARTTISVYANAAELLHYLQVQAVGVPELPARAMAYALGLSMDSIRRHARDRDGGALPFAAVLTQRLQRFAPLDRAVRRCAGPPLLKPLDESVPALSVVDVDTVLCHCTSSRIDDQCIDRIVEMTLQPANRVEAVLRAATEFGLDTGMCDWGVYSLVGRSPIPHPEPPTRAARRRAAHRRAWLTASLDDGRDMAPLLRAVTVWAGRFQAEVPLFVVRGLSDLDDIVATLHLLGVAARRVRVVWPAGVERDAELARSLAARLPGADIDGRQLQRVSRARRWRHSEVGLQIASTAGDRAPGGRDFFRALALIWIWRRAMRHLNPTSHEIGLTE